jgi:hypothetical protein
LAPGKLSPERPAALTNHELRQLDRCMIASIPRDDQVSQDRVAVRLTPPSRTVTAASPDCGFAHEGEQIEAAVDGILTANDASLLVRAALDGIRIGNFPEETVAPLQMSIRMD